MKTPNERESAILKYWQDNNIFQKSLDKNKDKEAFRYYDGPPYATGLPHFGSVLPSSIKDAFPRYKTMRGFNVPRSWGWDTHGLPVENLAEKILGFKDKKDIEEAGIKKFNETARGAVFQFREDWKKVIPRLGRWVDMDNDYRTLDATFMESNLWAFKELYKKGLVYEGYKVMPWCPHCETVLSNYEVTEGYKEIADLSAYVYFKIEEGEYKDNYFIAWTTTPWTLPGNVALALNKDFTYVLVNTGDKNIIVLKSSFEKINKEFSIVKEIKGEELIGLSYKPLFDYFLDMKNDKSWKTYHGDFVTDTDGTGIVHIAPAFGDDDMKLAQANGLPVIKHVNTHGDFVEAVKDFTGAVKPKDDHSKADIEVIKYLAHNDSLFAKEKYTHTYPHCWRCKTPLLNYATSSWFIKTTAVRDRMIEINNTINWYPDEIGHKRLHSWLENNRDWAVSRSRYWGTPLPVWKSENTESKNPYIIIGSSQEIKEKTRRNTYTAMRHGEAGHMIENVMSSTEAVSSKHHLIDKGIEEVKNSTLKLISENNIPDIIYSSPILRTRETADIIKSVIKENTGKDIEIIFDDRLKEEQYGDLDGQSNEVFNAYREGLTPEEKLSKRFLDGENLYDIRNRTGSFLYDIDNKNENKNILLVSHQCPINAIYHVSQGHDIRQIIQKGKICYKINSAEYMKIDFAYIPHNDDFELDFHRPYIDEIVFEQDGEKYKRLNEVLDVWYDAGSMPFSSQHFPFEFNDVEQKDFVKNLTVDFVAESLDQTRGWFYYMLFMSVALFDRAPFKNVMVGGMVLAEDGKKMSKSLGNFPELLPVVEEFGADSLRYFLLSSPVTRAEEYAFSQKMLNEINNKFFNKISNVISFLEMYGVKNLDIDIDNDFSNENELDKWIDIKLSNLIKDITDNMESYQLDRAARPILDFVEDLSTWYLRRCRDRFKDEIESTKVTKNLLIVLVNLSKVIAPFTPFMADEIYLFIKGFANVKDVLESVHLENWPVSKVIEDQSVIEKMSQTRLIIEQGLALRNKYNLKVRQPLASISVNRESINNIYPEIIKDELNVKNVIEGDSIELDINITEDLRKEGVVRDIIREIQSKRKDFGLIPDDKINLVIKTKENISSFVDIIKNTVNAENIQIDNTGEGEIIVNKI